jgi:hypothetical protein
MTSDPGPVPVYDSRVTRWLCATTHLQGSYAEQVADSFLDPSFTANAPAWGVDLVALTRHASLAVKRRRARDRKLRWTLALTALGGFITIAAWPLGAMSPLRSIFVTLGIAVAGWVVAWFQVFQHYEAVRQSSIMAMDQPDLRNQAPPIEDPPEITAAVPDVPTTEQRLEELGIANTVIFGSHTPFVGDGAPLDTWTMSFDLEPSADWAAGSGRIRPFSVNDLYERLLRDLPAAIPGGTGGRRLYVNGTAAKGVPGLVPAPSQPEMRPTNLLPTETVHRYIDGATETARTYLWFSTVVWGEEVRLTLLLRAMVTGDRWTETEEKEPEPAAVTTAGPEPEPGAEPGGSASTGEEPLSGKDTPWLAAVQSIEAGAGRERGDGETLVDPGWSVRPEGPEPSEPPQDARRQRLFIEGRTHVLLPPQQVFRDVKFVPRNPQRAWLVVAKPVTAAVTPLWLSSISRHLDRKYRIWKFMRRVEKQRRDLLDGVNPINYGAQPSLREDAAEANELKYYATVDEVQQFLVTTRTALDSIRGFLREQNVDLVQFANQSETILHQTSVRLHTVRDSAGNVGKGTTMLVGQGIVG